MSKRCGSWHVCWSVAGWLWLVALSTWPAAASAAPVYGGHATVLNVIYPEVWDPHIAGTIGPLAGFSPLYNQIVEFGYPFKARQWGVGQVP